ncbi:hypothetical protein V5O48_011406 [Marasmius crinis-equi]|uniref:Integral membrane protein n=1 Tax=Marasmius crinis-equi TaxID=585013 RepID=A0ABR3F5U0_9AGAR
MLDRVSFRLLVYALCGTLIYTIALSLSDDKACSTKAMVFLFGSHMSSFLFFCIGLNLKLVMVHGVDGHKAEKYYVAGSLGLAGVLAITSFALKLYTYNPELRLCTAVNSDRMKTLYWQVAIMHFWHFLTMVGELVAFSSVLRFMIYLKVFDSRFRPDHSQLGDNHELSASHQYPKPRGPKEYRNIVLRISLYPLISFTTLGIVSIGNIYILTMGMRSRTDLGIHTATRIIYLSRGMIYTLVACLDPAISRACKALYKHYMHEDTRPDADGDRVDETALDALQMLGHSLKESGEMRPRRKDAASYVSRRTFGASRSNITLPLRPEPAARLPPTMRLSRHRASMDDMSSRAGRSEYSELERRL